MITDEARLKDRLAWSLSPDFDDTAARADGARFLSAVVATSFDMGNYNTADGKNFDDLAVQRAYENLLTSLGRPMNGEHQEVVAE